MGWDQKTEMTEEQKTEFEVEQFIENAGPGEGTTLVVAIALYNLILDVKKGRAVEDHLIKDILKAALMMHSYAAECGLLELLSKNTKPEHTMQQFLRTLPLMRLAAGMKAAHWGNNLQKLTELLVEGKSDASK